MTEQIPEKGQSALTEVQGKLKDTTSGILSSIQKYAGAIAAKGQDLVDRIFPPEQRANFLAKLQSFMLANPKLSTFLGMNLLLTGVPLGLFILFSITVALFSIIVGLLLGLLGAVIFIVFAVGTALCIVLPTVFFTTACACFLFLWGLGGYYILKWANGETGTEEAPEGGAIGDKLNKITGGRLTGFMDAAKSERAKGNIEGFGDKHTKPTTGGEKQSGAQNGHPEKIQKSVEDTASKATKATGIDGIQKKTGQVTGTTKGGLSGGAGVDVPGL